MIVNVAGSFLIGFIMQLSLTTELISPDVRLMLTTGVMGGFTTYSAFSYETVRRWVNHFGPKIAAYLRKRRPKLFANAARSRILSGVCACETDLSG